MANSNDEFNILDPLGMMKGVRDAQMDAWSKMMVQLVNSEAYADATGKMLDVWLANSAPFRKMVEKALGQTLANLSLPSRGEIASLAERLTNIEMRLDDLDAKLDEFLQAARPRGKKGSAAAE